MKKRIVVLLIAGILLTGCVEEQESQRFNGSREGNSRQLIMEFSDMNLTDSQILELETGDVVEVQIESKDGQIDVSLVTSESDVIYEECDVATGSFYIDIEETGEYQVIITGKDAEGSVFVTVNNIRGE